MEEITDSTDWLNTPLATLAPVESSLRCQVCKDFFSTPMITSCSHTFCSICIRRYLSQEGKCPACRESDQEMKLRRNWAVEEMVAQFMQARKEILSFAQQAVSREADVANERPKKRRKVENGPAPIEKRSTRSHSRRNASQPSQEPLSTQDEDIEVQDSQDETGSLYEEEPAQPTSEPHDGRVECPNCSRRVKESLINSHLDRCLLGQAGNTPSPVRTPTPQLQGQIQPGSIAYSQNKSQISRDRLPTINYSLLTDNALRKKLRELGIPFTGSKELMRKRHAEWVNLWNANCDSQKPRTKPILLGELNTWERTLGRQVDRGATGVMVKEFDRDGWQKSNKGDFDDLIRRAREKRKAVAAEATANSDHQPESERDEIDNPVTQDAVKSPVTANGTTQAYEQTEPMTNGNALHQDNLANEVMEGKHREGDECIDLTSPQRSNIETTVSQRSRMFL